MNIRLQGGCQCGAIRYQIAADTVLGDAGYCHCRRCQRSSGAPVVLWMTVPAANVQMLRGVPKTFDTTPQATRSFCSQCGTQLFFVRHERPDQTDITVASLDKPRLVTPAYHAWTSSAQPWLNIHDDLKRFAYDAQDLHQDIPTAHRQTSHTLNTSPQATSTQQRLIVATWNVGMFLLKRLSYVIVEPAPYKDMRLRHIPRVLRNRGKCRANIIAIQELFDEDDIAYVVDKTRDRFPYFAYTEHEKHRMSPGLLILSEYPIKQSTFHQFASAPVDETLFMRKGMLHATIETPQLGDIELINTHNTSGGMLWSPSHPLMHWYRRRQYRQLFDIMKRFPNTPRIALGDFNAGPEASLSSYEELLRHGFQDAWTLHHGSDLMRRRATWDPQNPLNAKGPHQDQQAESLDGFYIDEHVQRLTNIQDVGIVFDKPIVRGPNDRRFTVSDHYGLELILQKKSISS